MKPPEEQIQVKVAHTREEQLMPAREWEASFRREEEATGGETMSTVERVDRSPMNKLRWCLQLSCGHEAWVTSKRRPTRKTIECPDSGCQNADATRRLAASLQASLDKRGNP